MKGKPAHTAVKKMPIYDRIRQILESARFSASRSVNTAKVVANWLVGRAIVEEEQNIGSSGILYAARKDFGHIERKATHRVTNPKDIRMAIFHTPCDQLRRFFIFI